MSDITSGLFALGGSALIITGTLTSNIISSVSKGRERKAAAAAAEKAAKAAERRPLYEKLVDQLHNAALTADWIRRTLDDPAKGPGIPHRNIGRDLGPVRETCRRIQIYGSTAAQATVSRILAETTPLWRMAVEQASVTEDALTQAIDAMNIGQAELIQTGSVDLTA